MTDSPLTLRALTHRSAAARRGDSNERLEYLGDAVLGAAVARILYESLPDEADEGTLTRARAQIIRRETLAEAARALGLGEKLAVGPGERKEGRQHHDGLLADAFEALVAATFLEQGWPAAETFVREALTAPLAAVLAAPPPSDPKTRLQEVLQAHGRGAPVYRLIEQRGTGHRSWFIVAVEAGDGAELARGEGASKRLAARLAAEAALAPDRGDAH